MSAEAAAEVEEGLDPRTSALLRQLGARLTDVEAKLDVLNDQQEEQMKKQRLVIAGAREALGMSVKVRDQLQEEQFCSSFKQTPALTRGMPGAAGGQQAVVSEAKMEVRVAENRQRIEEHEQSLIQLSNQVRMMATRLETKAISPTDALIAERFQTKQQLDAIAENQKIVAVSTKRALETAVQLDQQFQSEREKEFMMVLDGHAGGPFSAAAEEQQLSVVDKISEQDKRMDRLIGMVEEIAERVLPDEDGQGGMNMLQNGGDHMKALENTVHELQGKVEEIYPELVSYLSSISMQQQAFPQLVSPEAGGQFSDGGSVMMLQGLESRIEKSMTEVFSRLEALQEGGDNARFALWQVTNKQDEVEKSVEQLSAQCQGHFSKVKEHDMHFGFLRSSLEGCKQQILDLSEGLDRQRANNRLPRGGAEGDLFGFETNERGLGDFTTSSHLQACA